MHFFFFNLKERKKILKLFSFGFPMDILYLRDVLILALQRSRSSRILTISYKLLMNCVYTHLKDAHTLGPFNKEY